MPFRFRSTLHRSVFHPLLLGLVVGAVSVGLSHRAHSDADATVELMTYRAALDQISQGHPQSARILLQSLPAQGQMSNESALLLAYLQDQQGDASAARQTLGTVTKPSSLTTAYLNRLGTTTTTATTPVTHVGLSNALANPAVLTNTGSVVNAASSTTVAGGKRPDNAAHLSPSDARISKLEKQMADILNAERAKFGLGALAWDDDLASVARSHSAEMRDKQYFDHDSPTRTLFEPLDRYQMGIGETPHMVAENIYRVWGSRSFLTDKDVSEAHKALMNSPGHRANILLGSARYLGIGITTDATGNMWITQMFSKPN